MAQRMAWILFGISFTCGILVLTIGRFIHFANLSYDYNDLLHFSAGFILAFFFGSLAALVGWECNDRARRKWLVWILVMSVGIGWEAFEFFFGGKGMFWMESGGMLDTISDLILDGLGGYIGILLSSKFY